MTDFFNIPVKEKKDPLQEHTIVPERNPDKPAGVVQRTLWQKTVFTVYPNGMMFIKEKTAWFDKKQAVVKKKEKVKATMKPSKLMKGEEY